MAVQLYEPAFAEGPNVNVMDSRGLLLANGGEAIEQNSGRTVLLYERAFAEGQYVPAMYNVGLLLEKGKEGVTQDLGRAVQL